MSQDTASLYVVRDAAGAIYGPADIPTLQQWIAQGRITPQMHVAAQGTADFKIAADVPALHFAFNAPVAQTPGPDILPAPMAGPSGYLPSYDASGYRRDSTMAIASLVCGCAAFLCGVSAIAAIILGHIARGQIRREPERYEGQGMATAGMIIGYVYLALAAAVLLLYIVFVLLFMGMVMSH